MNIRDSPDRHAAAIVLLHGYPFDRSMWREQIDFLSGKGYQVVAPDLMSGELQFAAGTDRNTQRQAKACRAVNSMSDMAGDAAALMDELKIKQAVICGLSMGGYVALEFAQLFRSRVRALVLAGTRAPADNEQEKQARAGQIEQMLASGMEGITEASMPKLLAPKTMTDKPEVVDRLREMILRADPQCAAAAQRGMAERRDYTDDLSNIKAPSLIIVGRQDPIRPVSDAEFMRQRISNSRLQVIENAAHMTNMEQPEAFNRTLQEFLEANKL
jgi:pimeloyl-ACP methyl ester carboxylesterase